MFPFMDWSIILLIPVMIFAMYAQNKVKSTYMKFLEVPAQRGLTGREAARQMLDAAGLSTVGIEQVAGTLSDHYDPRQRVLRLSEPNFGGRSVAALGVACHEAGHAIQHARAYAPLNIRQKIFPVARFGSSLAWPIFIGGLILSMPMLMDIGILVFLGASLFAIITLPVEFDASNRAIKLLVQHGLVTQQEKGQAKKVLDAAALTYVAAALMSVVTLVRMIILRGGRD